MNKEESYTDLGTVRIHKNVIVSVAAIAAAEIEGVKRIGQDFKSGMLALLGKKTNSAIRVDIDKNGEVRIEIPLVVKYGFSIPEIAAGAQDNVRNALEKMTNLSLREININIQGIEKGE
ncbi:MAG: Asp23/Gls24 family envelope stress response protein [Candidatus Omnitrophica bacterium]|nr:Asp23/Gls24 family envelope stress response protein [Candidatus Omnitrophota bacterium]